MHQRVVNIRRSRLGPRSCLLVALVILAFATGCGDTADEHSPEEQTEDPLVFTNSSQPNLPNFNVFETQEMLYQTRQDWNSGAINDGRAIRGHALIRSSS